MDKDVFAVGLARQLRDLMGDLIENNEGLWEDLSIRLPIVREGLDGYGMVIHAMEDDAMDQFFLVSVYEGFSEEDLGDEILHECTEFADLDELESVTRGLLSRIIAERDILTEVREQIEKNDEASVRLENGRSIQVTLETEYGAEDGPYYIVQLVRNDAEAQHHKYEGHQGNYVGAVYWCVTDEKSLDEVDGLVKKALEFNEWRPVAEHCRMESLDEKIGAAEGRKMEGVGQVAEKDLGER